MDFSRRTALQVAGTAGLASLAGCSALADLLAGDRHEYALTVDPVEASPVDHALYDPDRAAPFDAAARDALDAILPEGRYTTYGFEPLPAGAYVEHEGRYLQVASVVTGRERMERTLVRADPVGGVAGTEEDPIPDDARSIDSLPAASARVVELLHEHHATEGDGAAANLLRGDAYVLRRPAELDGPIAGDLDGGVVTMDDAGAWGYRLDLATETIAEPVYETYAVDVAADHEAFREVVLATRVDATLAQWDLDREVRDRLEAAIGEDEIRETTPLAPPFQRLLDHLGLADVTVGERELLLWYDESLYRYGLFVSPAN